MRRWGVLLVVLALVVIGLRLRTNQERPAATVPAPSVPTDPRSARTPRPIHLSDGRARVEADGGLPFSLEGRVISTRGGAAIEGAILTISGGGTAAETRTDREGRFAWSTQRGGPHQLLSITAPGFVAFAPELDQSPVRFDARAGVRISEVTFYLAPEEGGAPDGGVKPKPSALDAGAEHDPPKGRVIGRVTDHEGHPVVAFSILALVRRGAIQRGEEQAGAFFDADGRYAFEDVRAGSQCLTAIALGHAASVEQCVEVPAGGEVRVDFQLGRATKITGRVIDRASRAPLPRARVSFESAFGGEALPVPVVASTDTDADGRFELASPAAGTRSLFVTADGHHHRVVPGVVLDPDRPPPPIEIDLLATEPGEPQRIESAGINAAVRADGDRLVIEGVSPGGGAAEAGLVRGDVLVKVDGVELSTLGMQTGVERLRGPEGSTVTVTIQRPPEEGLRDVVVTRRRVVNR